MNYHIIKDVRTQQIDEMVRAYHDIGSTLDEYSELIYSSITRVYNFRSTRDMTGVYYWKALLHICTLVDEHYGSN